MAVYPNPIYAGQRTVLHVTGPGVGASDSIVFLPAGQPSCNGAADKLPSQGGLVGELTLILPVGVYKACISQVPSPYEDEDFTLLSDVHLTVASPPPSPPPPPPPLRPPSHPLLPPGGQEASSLSSESTPRPAGSSSAMLIGAYFAVFALVVGLAVATYFWRRNQQRARQMKQRLIEIERKLREGVVSHKQEPYDEEQSAYGSSGGYGGYGGGDGCGGGGGSGSAGDAGRARKPKKQRAKKGAVAVEMSTAIVRNSDDEDEGEGDNDAAAMAAADALLASIAASTASSASRAGKSGGGCGEHAKKPPKGGEGDADDRGYEIYTADDDCMAAIPYGQAITRGEAVSGKHGPLRKGEQVWYNSRSLGPIPAKIIGVDNRGETYLIESSRLEDGDAIETGRERLSRVKPVQ